MAGGGIESESVAGVAAVEGLKTRFYLEGTGKKLQRIAPTSAAKKAAAAAMPAAAKIPASPCILMMLTSLLLESLLPLQERSSLRRRSRAHGAKFHKGLLKVGDKIKTKPSLQENCRLLAASPVPIDSLLARSQ
eukprot:3979271-Pleurochrysis_carterae.AAC.1